MDLEKSQSRKWLLTINNPIEKKLTHDVIEDLISNLTSTVYYCMSDEKGLEEETPHTHIFISFSSPVRFSIIKNLFPTAHISKAVGSAQANRDYILKTGKWLNTDKVATSIVGSFKEVGELPIERQGHRADMDNLYNMLLDNKSDLELIEANPNNIRYLSYADRVRQTLIYEKVKNTFRKLSVTYIYGETGTGKTRFVTERYKGNIYRISDYTHCFEGYRAEDCICFDEFSSSYFNIRMMLNLLDGYSLELPCRYSNKWAAYTKVYIISNLPFEKQYEDVKENDIHTYRAFRRRIHNVYCFIGDNKYIDCSNPLVEHNIDELWEK